MKATSAAGYTTLWNNKNQQIQKQTKVELNIKRKITHASKSSLGMLIKYENIEKHETHYTGETRQTSRTNGTTSA